VKGTGESAFAQSKMGRLSYNSLPVKDFQKVPGMTKPKKIALKTKLLK